MRQGLRFLRTELPGILATRSDVLSSRMIHVIEDLAGDWHRLDERIESLSTDIKGLADQDPACERLMTVPGIGPIISSAMVAAIGNGTASITRLQRLGREFQRAFRQARTSALGTLIESRWATSTSASGSPIFTAAGGDEAALPHWRKAQERIAALVRPFAIGELADQLDAFRAREQSSRVRKQRDDQKMQCASLTFKGSERGLSCSS